MKKKTLVIIPLIFLAGFWYANSGSGFMTGTDKSDAAELERAVSEKVVERGDIFARVSCTGKIVPRLEIEIKGKASGEITALHAEVSSRVEKGDLLIELDPSDEERNMRQAEVNLASSRARLDQSRHVLQREKGTLELDKSRIREDLATALAEVEESKKQVHRYRTLFKSKMISQENIDKIELQLTKSMADYAKAELRIKDLEVTETALAIREQDIILAQGNMESDEIALEKAKQRFQDTRIQAPITGVITERHVQKGQIISSPTSNVSGGTSLLVVADDSALFVEASVDECDIGQVKPGQRVEVTVDAYPEKRFDGTVVLVDAKGIETSNVVTFGVKMELEAAARKALKPGMTANVDIITAEVRDVLMVPTEAVVSRSGKTFLMIPVDSKMVGSGERMGKRDRKKGIADSDLSLLTAETLASVETRGRVLESGQTLETGRSGKKGSGRGKGRGRGDGSRRLIPVTTGITGEGKTEIVSGVEEGQKIALMDSKSSKWTKDGQGKEGRPRGGMGGPGGLMGIMGRRR